MIELVNNKKVLYKLLEKYHSYNLLTPYFTLHVYTFISPFPCESIFKRC